MVPFLISYDINEKDKFEYQPLWDKLKAIGAVRILYSEWVVLIHASQYVGLYNELSSIIQAKDRLLVQELGRSCAWDKLLISDDEFRALMRGARF